MKDEDWLTDTEFGIIQSALIGHYEFLNKILEDELEEECLEGAYYDKSLAKLELEALPDLFTKFQINPIPFFGGDE